MGERLERSPTSIAPEAPSRIFRRVGSKLSPTFSPEDLFGPDWLVIAQAESPEDQAQKPAILNNNPVQSAQEMATRIAERVKEYAIDLKNPQPMDLLEGVEVANVFFKVAQGGIGMADPWAFIVATVLIEAVRLANSNPNSENSSKLAILIQAAKKALIHKAEHEIAGKVAEKGLEMISDQLVKKD